MITQVVCALATCLASVVSSASSLALPARAAFGAPCVCFPIQHDGQTGIPQDPLGQAGWSAERLANETLRAVLGTDDVFLRAEALRSTLLELAAKEETLEGPRARAWSTLIAGLVGHLKLQAELAPYPRVIFEVPADDATVAARLAREKGVMRVERLAIRATLVCWFDERALSLERLVELSGTTAKPTLEPATTRGQALAAITLAFAAQSSRQAGRRTDLDPHELVREAVGLLPKDPRVQLVSSMISFDADRTAFLGHARSALENAGGDPWVERNLQGIVGRLLNAESLEDLRARLDERRERR